MTTSATPAKRHANLWIVKLGGSLAGSRDLTAWLDTLSAAAGRVVLVPGGGPFADRVREAQAGLGFDDTIAHHLALLAMEQFGRALAGLAPVLQPATSARAITDTRRAGKIPVWMPTRMTLGRPDIPETWAVTSDSLALWLAGRLGVRRVVLVKSATPPPGTSHAGALAASGLIDDAFPAFLARTHCRVWLAGPADRDRVAAALAGCGEPGAPIAPAP